ncbi:MAG: glycoside hydrolase family 5 protein [Methyloceanibacter sp.]
MPRRGYFALLLAAGLAPMAQASSGPVEYAGVNLPVAAFGADALPGTFGTNYIYPQASTLGYFAAKNMNVARIAVLWERLQHRLQGDLDKAEVARLDAVIDLAAAKGMRVIVDIHNYARYAGAVLGSPGLPPQALADLWRRLGERYKDNDAVIFGLMNEPNGLPTETWLEAANAAIAAIRGAGAKNLILVPGNGWSSARDWPGSSYGTPNSEAMLKVEDPEGNFAYDVHQYFDADFTGTGADCQSAGIGIETLTPVTEWARQHGRRAFLGEFGVGPGATCLEALDRVMRFLNANSDVWLGWTYWAGGEWWPADYFTNIQPQGGVEPPQMAVIEKYLPDAPVRR